jgi:hypothetical protein
MLGAPPAGGNGDASPTEPLPCGVPLPSSPANVAAGLIGGVPLNRPLGAGLASLNCGGCLRSQRTAGDQREPGQCGPTA